MAANRDRKPPHQETVDERFERLSEERRRLFEELGKGSPGRGPAAGAEDSGSTAGAEGHERDAAGNRGPQAPWEFWQQAAGAAGGHDAPGGHGPPPPWEFWRQAAGGGGGDTGGRQPPWQSYWPGAGPQEQNPWTRFWQQMAGQAGHPPQNPWGPFGQAAGPFAGPAGPPGPPPPFAGPFQPDPWQLWQMFGALLQPGPGFAGQPNLWTELWQAPGAGPDADRPAPGEPGGPPRSPLVAMKPSGSRSPFFCVHALLGSVFPYHKLALHIPPEQPFYGLQARGLDGRERPLDRIEDLAASYIPAIRSVQATGPYHLGGYSFGGWVAFEMARQLHRDGEQVRVLANFGAGVPPAVANPGLVEQIDFFIQYMEDWNRLAVNANLPDEARAAVGADPAGQQHPDLSPLQRVTLANSLAQLRYTPGPYAADLDLFVTEEQQRTAQSEPTMGWKILCLGEVAVHAITGNHLNMFEEPHVQDLAEQLQVCLERRG